MNTAQKVTAEDIIQSVREHGNRILIPVPGLIESAALKTVIEEYISFYACVEHAAGLSDDEYLEQRAAISRGMSFPAWEDDPQRWLDIEVKYARQIPDYLRQQSESLALTFLNHMGKLLTRITAQSAIGEGVSWDRYWKSIHDEYVIKQQKLASCLRDAADIFEAGQADSGAYPSLMGYREIDETEWCSPEQLRDWANLVKMSPVEVVFPKARPNFPGLAVDFNSIGVRGGAANPESAMRAMLVRETAVYVLRSSKQRYKVISDLVKFLGLSVSPQYVRSLLMKGRT